LARQNRELATSLRGLGKDAQTSAKEMAAVTDQIVAMGIAREDAVKIQQQVIRSPSERVPVAATARIAQEAQKQADIFGTDVTTESKALIDAIEGGTKALQEYVLARSKASAEEVKSIDTQTKAKGAIAGVTTALEILNRNVASDTHRESLSAWGQAWKDFGQALDDVGKLLATGWLGHTLTKLSDQIAGQVGWLGKAVSYLTTGKPMEGEPLPPGRATAPIPGATGLSRVTVTEKAATTGVGSGGADIQTLAKLLQEASSVLKEGQRFQIFSAHRPGDPGMHGQAAAVDV